MNRLQDKVAITTGAGLGIGRAIALLFAKEGASVIVADVNHEAGQATVDEITTAGAKAIFAACDVSDSNQVQDMIKVAVQTYDRIDILVNNAGISEIGTVVDTDEDTWDRVIGVNLRGVYLCSKYAIPYILKQGGGAVINIASVAGLAGLRNGAAYNASKGSVVLLTKNMALDFAEQGIRVNCVCPGATVTPMYEAGIAHCEDPEARRAQMTLLRPLGRLGEPRETAQTVLFLACEESSYITGTVVVVDGGVMAQFPGQVRSGM